MVCNILDGIAPTLIEGPISHKIRMIFINPRLIKAARPMPFISRHPLPNLLRRPHLLPDPELLNKTKEILRPILLVLYNTDAPCSA